MNSKIIFLTRRVLISYFFSEEMVVVTVIKMNLRGHKLKSKNFHGIYVIRIFVILRKNSALLLLAYKLWQSFFVLFSNVVNHDVSCLQILVVWWCFSRRLTLGGQPDSTTPRAPIWILCVRYEDQCIQILCRNNQNY